MTYDPKFTSSSQSSFDAPDDAEKYVLATIPNEESNGLLPTMLLVSLLLLVGLISLLWVSLGSPSPLPQPTSTPTPTPTTTSLPATATAPLVINITTPTPDLRVTEVIELIRTRAASDLKNDRPDLATVVAMLISTGVVSPDLILTPAATPTPLRVAEAETAESVGDPAAQVGTDGESNSESGNDNSIRLPAIVNPAPRESEDEDQPSRDDIEVITAPELLTPEIEPTSPITETAPLTATEDVSPTTNTLLPIVSAGETTEATEVNEATATPVEAEPTATDIVTATATLVATLTPTETPTLTITETITPTLEPIATSTPSATPVPTVAPIFASSLKGKVISSRDVTVYKGPSRIYGKDGILTANKEVNISDRDTSGEWIFVCCSSTGASGWVRQAEVPPTGNLLTDILSDEAVAEITSTPEAEADRPKANDVRWLTIRNAPASPNLPAWPAIPQEHYVLYRYNPGNQANGPIPQLDQGTDPSTAGVLNEVWTPKSRPQGEILTAATTDRGVYITASDGHIRKLKLLNGEQESIYQFEGSPNSVSVSVAIFDQTIYAASDGKILFAINEQNLEKRWSKPLIHPETNTLLEPITGINILGDNLYLGVSDEANQYLMSLDRREGGTINFTSEVVGGDMQFPAIGNQLVYVGSERISAFDAHDGKEIWVADEPQGITAPPVYSAPGVKALAELYVAANNVLFALDANTGNKLWSEAAGGTISGLALGESAIYASIENEIKAFARTDGKIKWTQTVNSPAIGGPYVDGDRILVVAKNGLLYYLDTADGSILFGNASLGDSVRNAPAVTSKYLFVPGENNKVFGWQGK